MAILISGLVDLPALVEFELELRGCVGLKYEEPPEWIDLMTNLQSLESLSITLGASAIEDDYIAGLPHVISNMESLTKFKLDVSECWKLTNQGISPLIESKNSHDKWEIFFLDTKGCNCVTIEYENII